ncbi:AlpA family phage regulatory protein [Ensifer sp. NBAIM29]|nr:AlpA family phage regulatory protein [Ensifer sp. NBAIM29]
MHEQTPNLVSLREVCVMTSLSRTAINQRRAASTFPRAVPLGDKRIAFVRSEVEQWIRDRHRSTCGGERMTAPSRADLAATWPPTAAVAKSAGHDASRR